MEICENCNGDGFVHDNESGDLQESRIGSSRYFNIKAWVCPVCNGTGSTEKNKEE